MIAWRSFDCPWVAEEPILVKCSITPKQDWEQHETKQLEILKPSDLQQKHLAILIDSNDWLYIDGNLQKDNSS